MLCAVQGETERQRCVLCAVQGETERDRNVCCVQCGVIAATSPNLYNDLILPSVLT